MGRKRDAEVRAMQAIATALDGLPEDAQFRALAYMVSRVANVATCEASEWLYAKAVEARNAASERGSEGT